MMKHNPQTPKLVDVELKSSGWINKYLLIYELPNGELYSYESASRKGLDEYKAALAGYAEGEVASPDAVCIVPILPDGSVLLIREFRYPVNAWIVALPAGLKESDETIVDCVNRELHEETGYKVRADLGDDAVVALPQTGFSSVGMTDENVQVVFAYVEEDGSAEPEPSELIEPFILPKNDIKRFLETNEDIIGTRCQLLLLSLA